MFAKSVQGLWIYHSSNGEVERYMDSQENFIEIP